jgi:hypothetical protein
MVMPFVALIHHRDDPPDRLRVAANVHDAGWSSPIITLMPR